MALIVPYQSQAGIQTGNAGSAAQYRGAGAFVTPGQENLGQGLQQLAAGVGKLGKTLLQAEVQKRQEQMELSLIEDMQGFQSESQAWTDNYQKQNQGKNAVNAEVDAQAFYKEKVDALRLRWEGNDRAQLYIQRNAGNVAVSGIGAMRDYGNKQQAAWKDSVFAGQAETFKDVASDWRSTPGEIQAAYNDFAGKNNAYLMSKGMDATAAQMQTDRVYREAMAVRTEQSFIENINNGNIAGARASLEVMQRGDAADFSAQYESGLQGSTAIGYDKNGGTSYGKFQISSKAGTFDEWLKWLDKNGHEGVAQELRASGPADTGSRNGNTPEAWRALVQSGAITDDMQLQFIKESHLDPALEKLPKDARDAILADGTLYRAFFSTAVQHGAGGAVKLIGRNWEKSGGDKDAFLDSLYADRKTQFSSSTDEVQGSAAARFDRERAALGVSIVSPEKVGKYQNMLQTATREKLKTDSIALYGERYPENPDQAARAALQDPALAKDPETQKSVVGYFDWLDRQQREAAKQAEQVHLEQSYSGIAEAAQKGDFKAINSIIIGARPEDMSKLQTFANRIVNGDGLVSDPNAYNDALMRAEGEEVFNVMAEYGDRLNMKEIREIQNVQVKSYLAREKVFFNEEAEAWLGTDEGKKYKDKTGATSNKLYMKFKSLIPEGGFKDIASRQKTLAAFWRKEMLSKPGTLWGTNDVDTVGFRSGEYAAQGYYPQKGERYQWLVGQVKTQIKAREGVDREPTEGELTRAWQAMHGVAPTVKQDWSLPESSSSAAAPAVADEDSIDPSDSTSISMDF